MESTASEIKILSSSVFEEAICRLCASKSQQTVNVFDEEVEPLDLINTISQCLQIKISSSDILPTDICLTCCEKLREYFEFYTLCSHSQKSLAELYRTSPSVLNCEGRTPADHQARKSKDGKPSEIEPSVDDSEEIIVTTPTAIQKDNNCRRKLRKPLKIVRGSVVDISGKRNAKDVNGGGAPGVSTAGRTTFNSGRKKTPSTSGTVAESSQENDGCGSDDAKITIKKLFQNFKWECTACGEDLNSLGALKAHHHEVHQQLANFKCKKCGKLYNRYRSFVRHVKLHSDPKRFSCQTCGKKFSLKTVLQSHQTVHTEERPHVCPQCGKAFKQFSSLYLHSRSHLPEQAKPKFHCPICKKMFSSKHTMDNHLKIHTGEKNFSCDICGKRFIAKGSLNYHMLSHDDAKNHTCSLCKKSFKTARLLAKHSSLHTGVKPHQCDVCGKQFRERSGLKEHGRIHTGEMPYVCEYCGKAFRFKGILTVHIRQHTGERPYRCSDCCRSFTNWANYNKHIRRRHDQRIEPASPPSTSLPSLDFGDPVDLPLSADALNIQDFVIDHEIFRIPSTYNSFNSFNYCTHLSTGQTKELEIVNSSR